MPQVEIILLTQLASTLATPMLIVDPDGDLIFFNESAEPLGGRRFDEMGEFGRDDWPAALHMTDASGAPICEEDRPLLAALDRQHPAYRRLWTRGFDGVSHALEGTGIPLIARDGRLLGALGLYWEPRDARRPRRPRPRPASAYALEIILMQRVADSLAVPIFISDPGGKLLYFNQAAQPFFGRRLEDVIDIPTDELYARLQFTDEDGSLLKAEDHPAGIAGTRCEPAHRRFSARSLDGEAHEIEATAIPLIGQSGDLHGAAGFFWELEDS